MLRVDQKWPKITWFREACKSGFVCGTFGCAKFGEKKPRFADFPSAMLASVCSLANHVGINVILWAKYLRAFIKSKIIQKSSKNPVSVIAPSEGTTSLPSTRMGKLSLLLPPCVLIPSSVLPGHWPGKPRLQLTSYIIRYGSRCLLFAVCGGSVEEWILL